MQSLKLKFSMNSQLSVSCNCTHVLFYFCEIVYTRQIQYNMGTIVLSIFTPDNHIHNALIVCLGLYTVTRMLKLFYKCDHYAYRVIVHKSSSMLVCSPCMHIDTCTYAHMHISFLCTHIVI